MFLVPEFIFFFIHYDDSYKYPNINLLGISSGVVILLAMKLAAREVEVRVPCRHWIFFFIFFMFNGKEEGGGGLRFCMFLLVTRLLHYFYFFFGKEIKQGFRRCTCGRII